MGKELINKINELNDSQAVQLFMFFGEKLLGGLEEEDLTKKIDPGLKTDNNLNQIIELDPDLALKNLSPAESSAVARKYLLYIANDENLSPLLVKAMNEFKEKPVLIVETILAIGFVASMLIFASSTEIKGKVGKTSFKKGKASPALIKALLEPFVKIIDKL
jgi:hypothetical protein